MLRACFTDRVLQGALRTSCHSDQCVLRLHCADQHGLWPLSANRPLPPPVGATTASAGSRWQHARCSACGAWTAQLLTLRAHGAAALLTAAGSDFIHGVEHLEVGLRAWYDGATVGRADGAAAGAAAILWHTGNDAPEQLARRLPADTGNLQAECEACMLICEALVHAVTRPRTAVIFGDCAPVVRHAQGAGRLREPMLATRLDQALARAYAAGWHITWVHIHRSANGLAHTLARRTARG